MSQQLSLFNNIPVTIINVTGINEIIDYFEESELEDCDFINGKWYYYAPNLSRIKGAFIINVKLNNENIFIAYEPVKDIIYYPLHCALRNENDEFNICTNFSYFPSSVLNSLGIIIDEEIENYIRKEYNKLKLKSNV